VPDRRGFFKDVLREMISARESVNAALESLNESLNDPEQDPWRPDPPRPAGPATGLVDDGRLAELAREAGLASRLADVRRAARAGVRLTPTATRGGRSHLGGSPDLPADFDWPTRNGRELAFLAQIDLAELTEAGVSDALPEAGLLLVFADCSAFLSGLSPDHAGGCRVLYAPPEADLVEDAHRSPEMRALAVELTRELQLPSAYSFATEALALEPEEMDAWEDLRSRLAQAQGVELEDDGYGRMALHRVLGYQDEVGREVELDCQLASSGLDAGDVLAYFEVRDEHQAEARRWRLLLQVTAGSTVRLAEGGERLFVCIRDDDLLAQRFDAAWALLR
jgi:uncharacterized protein YwqG